MLTGHKAKGLEWDDVFVLDKELIGVGESQQERNLLYVMQTRAKSNLTYVTTEGFKDA
jgi:superfamily I DNA/RNA helicase